MISTSNAGVERVWPAWQQERAKRLHRIFTNVERRLANGLTISRVFKHPSWYNRQRFYRCDPSRRRQFGVGTLIQLFYHWRKNGRIPSALGLKYRSWNKGLRMQAKIKSATPT